MTNNLIPRRRVLAGAGALVANGFAASHLANAQGRVRSPAAPLVRPADFILKNGNVITIDPASTIVQGGGHRSRSDHRSRPKRRNDPAHGAGDARH